MPERLALAFGDESWTTARHLIDPLRERVQVDLSHGAGSSFPDVAQPLLWVESGIPYLPPLDELQRRRSAAWLIDTHRGMGWRGSLARAFDVVFVAQHNAVQPIGARTRGPVIWLPLAVDRAECAPGPPWSERTWDVAFCGAAPPGGFRHALLSKLEQVVHVAPWRAFTAPQEMMARYRDSRIVVNVPIAGDLNMRAFEAAGAGALLVTGPMDSLDEVLPARAAEVVPSRDVDRWTRTVVAMLASQGSEDRSAHARHAVLAGHTYDHRADQILAALDGAPRGISRRTRAGAYAAAHQRWGDLGAVRRLPLDPVERARAVAVAAAWRVARIVKQRSGIHLSTGRF